MGDGKWTSIRVRGHLGMEWRAWFDGMTITKEEDGTTALTGYVIDQAALHGLLIKIRDLGLELIRVEVGAEPPHHRHIDDAG
jgi:hypothetical protein